MEAMNPETLYFQEYYVKANSGKERIHLSPGGYFLGIMGHVLKNDMILDDSGYLQFKVAPWGYREKEEPATFVAEVKIPVGWGFAKAGYLFPKPLLNLNSGIPYVIFCERIPTMKFVTVEALPKGY